MKNLSLKPKNILTSCLILFGILGCYCLTQNISYADDGANDYKIEQITWHNVDIAPYVRQTRRRIKNNWYPPTTSFEHTATITLTINKNGELLNCVVSDPSPDEGFNNSLIEAAQKTKYSPLPSKIREDSIDISLEFSMQRRNANDIKQ